MGGVRGQDTAPLASSGATSASSLALPRQRRSCRPRAARWRGGSPAPRRVLLRAGGDGAAASGHQLGMTVHLHPELRGFSKANSGMVFQVAGLVASQDNKSAPLLLYADASISGQSLSHHPIWSSTRTSLSPAIKCGRLTRVGV